MNDDLRPIGDALPAALLALAGGDANQLRTALAEYPALLEELALDGSDSEPERLMWATLRYLKIPDLDGIVQQHRVMSFRLDMALVDQKIGFEIDGFDYHSDRRAFIADRRRHRWIERLGWRVVRFAASEVLSEPVTCAYEMAAAVRAFRKPVEREGVA